MEMRTENSWGGYKRFFLYFGPGGHFLRRGPRTKYNLFRNSEELSPQANPEALLQGTEWRPWGLCCALRTGFQLCVQGVIQAELRGGGGGRRQEPSLSCVCRLCSSPRGHQRPDGLPQTSCHPHGLSPRHRLPRSAHGSLPPQLLPLHTWDPAPGAGTRVGFPAGPALRPDAAPPAAQHHR